jgi:hypothetical protein
MPGRIKPAPASPAEHLQQFIATQLPFLLAIEKLGFGNDHAANGEINAGGQPSGGHDDTQLPSFGQRLDHAGPGQIAEAAVMPSYAFF